ncbi:MAG: competence protein ComE, partial [Nostoc sp.]
MSRQRYFLYIFLLIFPLTGCQRVQSYNQRPAPLPQDPLVQVYFNHSESSEYKEAYRQQT